MSRRAAGSRSRFSSLLVALTFLCWSSICGGQTLTAAVPHSTDRPVDDVAAIDSLALVALYLATGGPEWTGADGWLIGRLSRGEWSGVTVRSGRVVSLDLAAAGLRGELPDEIGDLTSLRSLSLDENQLEGSLPAAISRLRSLTALFLAGNRLTDLPDLSPLKSLVVVDISQNRLTFEDIVPNLRSAEMVKYDGQGPLGHPIDRLARSGETVEIAGPFGGGDCRYQWYKDGLLIPEATGDRLLITSVSASDAGSYTMRLSNPAARDLTLQSYPIVLSVLDDESTEPSVFDWSSIHFFGDIRIRGEMDRNSKSADGTPRPDRDRLRYRVRAGLQFDYDERFVVRARIRTGPPSATQSPYIAFGDELEPGIFAFDQAFIRTQWNGGALWVGKNAFPFWGQNEVFWDDDAMPEGVALTHSRELASRTRVTINSAYFFLQPAGSTTLIDLTRLAGAQLVLSSARDRFHLDAATGYFDFSHNPDVVDTRLGDLDYRIGVAGLRASMTGLLYPVSIGADLFHNFEDYRPNVFNRDEKLGYAIGVELGRLDRAGDWLLSYRFAHIEKLAVVAGYAQDDWLRWGSDTITRASNFRGHHIGAAVALGTRNVIEAHFYVVEGIKIDRPDATALEDGIRLTIDWSITFP